jgi:hypothetical protein
VAGAASVLVAVGALGAGALVLDPGRPAAIASAATGPGAAGTGAAGIDADATADDALTRPLLSGLVPVDLTPALTDAYYDLPSGYADGCHLDYAAIEPPECRYGPPEGATPVMLLGDSHAQQWLPALEVLALDRGWRLRAVTKAACPLVEATVWNHPLKRAYRECDAWRDRVLEMVADEQPEIVLVASADMYDLVDAPDDARAGDQASAWDAALRRYLSRLVAIVPRVIVLADTPRPGYLVADCLAEAAGIEACDAARDRMVDEAYREREAAAVAAAGAGLVDATDRLCTPSECPLIRGTTLVFRDAHHLSATFSARLSGWLGDAVDATRP